MKDVFLCSAFSLQMVKDYPCKVMITEVKVDDFPDNLKSAVGHQDTAAVLGVPMNRVNVTLEVGDVCYVAQLQGGRLPEGATKLPEGYSFRFFKVEIEAVADAETETEAEEEDAATDSKEQSRWRHSR